MDTERIRYLDVLVMGDFVKAIIGSGVKTVFVVSTEQRAEERNYLVKRMQEELSSRGLNGQVSVDGHTICPHHNIGGHLDCPRKVDAYRIDLDYFVDDFERRMQEETAKVRSA